MALVDMLKVRLIAVTADRRRLLKALQKLGCVQIEPYRDEAMKRFEPESDGELERIEQTLSRLGWAIHRLSKLDSVKKGMFAARDTAGEAEIAAAWAAMGQTMESIDALEGIDRAHSEARAEESRAQVKLRQLEPYRDFHEPLEKLGRTRLTMSAIGTMDARRIDATRAAIKEAGLAGQIDVVSIDKDGAHVFVLSPLSEWNAMNRLLKDADFSPELFEGYTGTPASNMEAIRGRIAELKEVHAQLDKQAKAMCDQLPQMRILYDVLTMERDRDRAAALLAGTKSVFMLTGWVPAEAAGEVEKQLRAISPSCVVEFAEPGEDDNPPVLMRNNRFFTPYQSVVAMYSLPDSRGLDPTVIMSPFFICFFGMMVSDAGYGIVMGLIAALATKFLKLRGQLGDIVKILIAGGAATVFWGALYGGWFGETINPLMFSPMDKPLEMMILCIGLGMVHIITSLVVAMYMNIKRHKVMDAIYDQASWIAVLLGVVMLVYQPLAQVGMVLALVGVAVIVLFGGRAKKNIVMRIGSGLGKLYGVSSYLSDLLSYARLFGMGLATGVIGMVINLVAGMMWGNPITSIFSIVIFVFGHAANLAINALGAYVHSCRLQYIEFFSRFYEDGGKEFRPLRNKTKYVDIVESDAA